MGIIKASDLQNSISVTAAPDKHKSKEGHLNRNGELEFLDRDFFWAKAYELTGENPRNEYALYLKRGHQSGMETHFNLIWRDKDIEIGRIIETPGSDPRCFLDVKEIKKAK